MTSLMKHGRLFGHHSYSLHRISGPLQAIRSHAHIPLEGRLTSITSNIECAKQLNSTNISSDPLIRIPREAITHIIGVLAAGLVLAAGCAPAEAYNVRLQDVENKAMQAGEQPGACYTAPSSVAPADAWHHPCGHQVDSISPVHCCLCDQASAYASIAILQVSRRPLSSLRRRQSGASAPRCANRGVQKRFSPFKQAVCTNTFSMFLQAFRRPPSSAGRRRSGSSRSY